MAADRNDPLASAGQYYLEELVSLKAYIENVVDDTVFYDSESFDLLLAAERDRQRSYPERCEEKMRIFLRYLSDRETAELKQVMLHDVPWCERITARVGERIMGVDETRNLMRQRPTRVRKDSPPPSKKKR